MRISDWSSDVCSSDLLLLVDSEVDETPFFSDTNMFSVNFDGSLQQSYAFTSVSTEPTGVAFDPATGRLYVSDDDANKVYVVDQANPTVKLAEFSTDTFGSTRTSDITMAPDGNLFIRSEEHTSELQSLMRL